MTRAKDISKIVTDADLSGTLDVTGTVTAGGLTVDGDATLGGSGDTVLLQTNTNVSPIYFSRSTVTDQSLTIGVDDGDAIFNSIQDEQYGGYEFKSTFDGTGTRSRLSIANNGDISFYEDTGTTPKLFWDASAESLGIGTSSPDSALHVYKQTNDRSARFQRISSQYIDISQTSGVNEIKSTGKNFEIGVTDASELIFDTNNIERMRIDSSGNVGIGTNSPAGKLHIKATSDSVNDALRIESSINSHYYTLSSDAGNGSFRITKNGTERMRIDSSGRVGIGATALGARLNILGANSDTWAASATNGLALNGTDSAGTSTITTYLDSSSLRIGAGVTQKTGITITGQSTGTGSTIQFRAGNSERMRIRATGNVGIGDTSPQRRLSVDGIAKFRNSITLGGSNSSTDYNAYFVNESFANNASDTTVSLGTHSTRPLIFATNTTERMRLDSSGNVHIGGTAENAGSSFSFMTSGGDSYLNFNMDGRTSPITNTNGCYIWSGQGASGDYAAGTLVLQSRSNQSRDIAFITGTTPTERMRIDSSGNVGIGVTSDPILTTSSSPRGQFFQGVNGGITSTAYQASPLKLNRLNTDGNLVDLRQAGTLEGQISVSGTTVTYGGGHLARWSRLLDNSKDTTIVKGTVMTNLDEMVEWSHEEVLWTDEDELPDGVSVGDVKTSAYTEDNEQLNKMAVSSVEGDANVAGVFVNWDDDDDYNDMNIAMTGDMVIRIAQGTTVARGDLLMSAGDGTAKPQGDDIVRSKTIAKVTSTNVSHTYDDGTYLVPCVLMAC